MPAHSSSIAYIAAGTISLPSQVGSKFKVQERSCWSQEAGTLKLSLTFSMHHFYEFRDCVTSKLLGWNAKCEATTC